MTILPGFRHRVSDIRCLVFLLLVFFISICGANSAVDDSKSDSTYAYRMLTAQCSFGPRPVGTHAHRQTRDFLLTELSSYTDSVQTQEFHHFLGGKDRTLWNIIARFGNTSQKGILLCAHWDTRPTADKELAQEDRAKPISGANDGASGVAVLLELAKKFKAHPPSVPVTIVLFDGEDYGPGAKDMFIGSKYFASHLNHPKLYKYGILLDMVGDKNLTIYRERNSQMAAPWVNDIVWKAAAELGYKEVFCDSLKYTIIDDHLPLIAAEVPCINLIDFDYPYWHTLSDTADKCSPESLRIVAETVAKVVYDEKP